jgi:hypothetical protein
MTNYQPDQRADETRSALFVICHLQFVIPDELGVGSLESPCVSERLLREYACAELLTSPIRFYSAKPTGWCLRQNMIGETRITSAVVARNRP